MGRKGTLPHLGSELDGGEGDSEAEGSKGAASALQRGQPDEAPRRCLACGSAEHNGRSWHRHPLTKQVRCPTPAALGLPCSQQPYTSTRVGPRCVGR